VRRARDGREGKEGMGEGTLLLQPPWQNLPLVIIPEVITCSHWMLNFKNKLPHSLTDSETCKAFKKNAKAYLTFNSVMRPHSGNY
jgi:hypothetical protein